MNIDDTLEAQAHKWSVKLSSDDVDKQVLEQFEQWRSADPRHEPAFQSVDRIWRGIASLEHLRRYAVLPRPQPTVWQRLQSNVRQGMQTLTDTLRQPGGLAVGMAAALMLAIGFPLISTQPETISPVATAQYTTGRAQVEVVTLFDGSVVTLGPESSLSVNYHQHKRSVQLMSGSGLFAVSRNPQRPFVVQTGTTETRVLGTVFSVEHKPQGVRVAVKEGKVRVARKSISSSSTAHAVLTTGQVVSTTAKGEVGAVDTMNPDSVGAWTQGRLVFENATLEEVVADANRYYDGLILLVDKETAELRISIVFNTDNIDKMIDDLAKVLFLDVNREQPGYVILGISH